MRGHTRPLLVILLAASLAASAGCRAARTNDRLRIGVFFSLSGGTANYGISASNGVRMAVEEANAVGGIGGRRVELVLQDTRSDVRETGVVVRRLLGHFRVHALLGEAVSSRSLAAAPIAQAAGVPMLTPSSTHPDVTRPGDYIFRSCYTDPFQGEALARFAVQSLRARRAAVIFDEVDEYSLNLARVIRVAFAAGGGQVVAWQSYRTGDRDFTFQIAEAGAARADVIFVPGYYQEAGQIARQARAIGVDAPLVGGDGWDSQGLYQIGGPALHDSFYSNHFSADDPDPVVQKFVRDYLVMYGSTPDAFAATAYDAARIMLDACARAGSLDGAAIRDALAATNEFRGVTGTVSFDRERNAVKPLLLIRIKQGGQLGVQERLLPRGVAHQLTR